MYRPISKAGVSLLSAAIVGTALVCVPAESHAATAIVQQQGDVTGTVTDKDGLPVVSASVIVVGTKNVTTTDQKGAFTLRNVPRGATIRIALIGYSRQDIKWTGQPLNVTLEEVDNRRGRSNSHGYRT